ncbi:putative uncharacterized protein [Pseudomonas sp. StFLB209]|nr:putative uncharacterized protein [Pseudomonas sp. StFLB209]
MNEESLLRQERRQARRLLDGLIGLLPAAPRAAGQVLRPKAGWPASKAAG